jgi:hypothetical protein
MRALASSRARVVFSGSSIASWARSASHARYSASAPALSPRACSVLAIFRWLVARSARASVSGAPGGAGRDDLLAHRHRRAVLGVGLVEAALVAGDVGDQIAGRGGAELGVAIAGPAVQDRLVVIEGGAVDLDLAGVGAAGVEQPARLDQDRGQEPPAIEGARMVGGGGQEGLELAPPGVEAGLGGGLIAALDLGLAQGVERQRQALAVVGRDAGAEPLVVIAHRGADAGQEILAPDRAQPTARVRDQVVDHRLGGGPALLGQVALGLSAIALDDDPAQRQRAEDEERQPRDRADRHRGAVAADPARHPLAHRVAVRRHQLAGLEPPQLVGQGLGGRIARGRLVGHGASDDRHQVGRRLGGAGGQRRDLALDRRGDHLGRGAGGVGRGPGQDVIQHRAQAEHVGPLVDRLAAGLLGRHVGRRAHDRAGHGQGAGVGRSRSRSRGDRPGGRRATCRGCRRRGPWPGPSRSRRSRRSRRPARWPA